MEFDGFDWDDGNWPKCGKHGVTQEEIEGVLQDPQTLIYPDAKHSVAETRELALGRAPQTDRPIAVFFTLRRRAGGLFIRPISARFMHLKEVLHYEQTRSDQG